MIVWLTGLPCSGKTTLASALSRELASSGTKTVWLDGDLFRHRFWPELGFSASDRNENVLRFGELAWMLSRAGIVAVVSVVSPYRAARLAVRRGSREFLEVYVNAPLFVCEQRDVKGMYCKARAGELPGFTGVDDTYEPPAAPEVECHTDMETIDESVEKILRAIDARMTLVVAAIEMAESCSRK